jgi:hypothetical protein
VDTIIALELARGLNTLPARCDFDKHTFFFDSNRLVKSNKFPGLGLGCLLVKGETGVDFGRDTAGNDGKNLFTKFDELQFHVSGGIIRELLENTQGGQQRLRLVDGHCHPFACRMQLRHRSSGSKRVCSPQRVTVTDSSSHPVAT